MPDVQPIGRERNPFPRSGMTRGDNGLLHYDNLPTTLIEMLRQWADQTPNAEAVVELGGERLTYRQLWDHSSRVAGGLRAAGVVDGDRIAVRYPAGVRWVLAFLGSIMAGGVPISVNTRSSEPEVTFILQDAGARLDLAPQTPLPSGAPYVAEGLSGDDPAAMFYTSGTTGKPKGVPTSHVAFLTNATNMVRTLGLPTGPGQQVRTLISVPLFHVTGCNSQLLTAFLAGGAAVIMPTLDRAALLASLVSERVNLLVTVPAVYALLLRQPELQTTDVGGLRWAGYGGAAIAPSLVAEIQQAFPAATVFNGYGMTETASLITVLPHADAVAHADSVGYAVPSVDLAIQPIDHHNPDTGELLCRGVNVTGGYWNRPEATASTIVDGWLHTGDIVRVDDAGRIHIVDRTKDIIIRGGENISSVEVEGVLAAAPTVLEAAVIAVPDEVMGEKVGAVLFGGEDIVDVATVIAYCRAQLADFKVPQYVSVSRDPLPRNAGGKVIKATLRGSVTWRDSLR